MATTLTPGGLHNPDNEKANPSLPDSYASNTEEAASHDMKPEEPVEKKSKLPNYMKEKKVPIWALFKFADGLDRLLILLGVISALVSGVVMPVVSIYLGRGIEKMIMEPANIRHVMRSIAIDMVYIGIVGCVTYGGYMICFIVSGLRQVGRMKERFLASVLCQEMAWHDEHKPGELIQRMDGDTTVIQNGINDSLGTAFSQLGFIIGGYAVAFSYSWQLTLIVMAQLPFIMLCATMMGRTMYKLARSGREGYAKAGEVATEALENIRIVQAFSQQGAEIERYQQNVKNASRDSLKLWLIACNCIGGMTSCAFFAYALALWFSSYLVKWGDVTVSHLSTALISAFGATMSLGFVSPSVIRLIESCGGASALFDTIDRKPVIDIAVPGKIPVGRFPKDEITLDNVTFSYPTRSDEKVFNGVSLNIQIGKVTAFSGPTGCGKSTIVQLLQRMYDPCDGNVRVDGIDLREIDLTWWRERIGVVSQEPSLFSGTIADNVRVGKQDATQQEIEMACRMANIHSLIMSLPKGYETNAGAVGSQLSGGQRQRIAIARALVRQPRILILDEATSALDRQSELEVQEALHKITFGSRAAAAVAATGGRSGGTGSSAVAPRWGGGSDIPLTVVIVAHRIATIQDADLIYYLEPQRTEGSLVAESGTFSELMALKGQFSIMANTQAQQSGVPLTNSRHVSASPPPLPFTGQAEAATCESDLKADNALAGPVPVTGATHEPSSAAAASHLNDNEGLVPIKSAYLVSQPGRPDSFTTLEEKENKALVNAPIQLPRFFKLQGTYGALTLGMIGSFFVGISPALMPLLLAHVFYELGSARGNFSKMEREVSKYALGSAALGAAVYLGWALQYFYHIAGERIVRRLRTMLFGRLLAQEAAFYDTPGYDAGSLSSVLTLDTERVHSVSNSTAGFLVQTTATLITGLIIAFIYQWKIALLNLPFAPLIAVNTFVQQLAHRGVAYRRPSTVLSEDLVKADAFMNVRTVAAFNAQRITVNRYAELVREERNRELRNAVIVSIGFGLGVFSGICSTAVSYYYGGILISRGEANFNDVFIASITVSTVIQGLGNSANFLIRLKESFQSMRRIFSLLDRKPEFFDSAGNLVGNNSSQGGSSDYGNGGDGAAVLAALSKLPPELGPDRNLEIEFDNVTFTYPSRPQCAVLSGVTSVVDGRESTGVMGVTGSGKSTIVSLIEKFYQCDEGKIRVNGINIRDIDTEAWRAALGYVSQEPSLFSGTIKENILYGSPTATEAEIAAAVELAQLSNEISAFPAGLDTQIGYRGRSLSGGQKQRVAIARALVRQPRLLLFDEGTSALDNVTESRVLNGISEERKKRDMGVVSVAHRLTTISNCDKIMLMDGGKVLEQGSPKELLALGGEYKVRWDLYMKNEK